MLYTGLSSKWWTFRFRASRVEANLLDAEGFFEGVACPQCGAETVTFRYREGFEEHECPRCGYRSDAEELDELTRFSRDLLEATSDGTDNPPPIPRRTIKA